MFFFSGTTTEVAVNISLTSISEVQTKNYNNFCNCTRLRTEIMRCNSNNLILKLQ